MRKLLISGALAITLLVGFLTYGYGVPGTGLTGALNTFEAQSEPIVSSIIIEEADPLVNRDVTYKTAPPASAWNQKPVVEPEIEEIAKGSTGSSEKDERKDSSSIVAAPKDPRLGGEAKGNYAGNPDTYKPPPAANQTAPLSPPSGYKASTEILATIEDLGLTSYGAKLFIGASPEYVDKVKLRSTCNIDWTNTYRGCYMGTPHRILTIGTNIASLESVKNVIMAHEMLHAAWRYYPKSKRDELTKEMAAFVKTLPADSEVNRRIAIYDKEKADIPNEYHSFLGTVEMTLSPYLEKHYATYFKDRKAIVNMYNEFDNQIASFEAQKDSLQYVQKAQVYVTDVTAYNASNQKLLDDVAYFNANATSYTREKYETDRAALVQRLDLGKAEFSRLEGLKAELDYLKTEYNRINDEHRKFYDDYASVYG